MLKLGLVLSALGISSTLLAGPRDVAKKVYDRLAGVPPSEAEIQQMATLIAQGQLMEAAKIPLATETFLSVTVKNMAAKWTNVDEVMDVPLNDYTATVVGMIRDDMSFDRVLYDNILYTGDDSLQAQVAYSPANNDHFARFESNGTSYLTGLTQRQQSSLTGLSISAGVMTLRSFGDAYFNAGTNRRAVRFTLKTFLCRDLEQVADNTRSDAFIRRDVDRAPGGDPRTFRTQCAGCHTGMDPLSKAFAAFDFVNNRITYTPNALPDKINRNGDTFPAGYVTKDEEWRNLWIEGANANMGWKGAATGKGPESYGRMLAASDAFPECMAERVFEKVCMHAPASDDEKASVKDLATDFAANNYNMKHLFAGVANACLGE